MVLCAHACTCVETHALMLCVEAAHLVDIPDASRVKEDALGKRGFSTVDVRADADVADVGQSLPSGLAHRSKAGRTPQPEAAQHAGAGA